MRYLGRWVTVHWRRQDAGDRKPSRILAAAAGVVSEGGDRDEALDERYRILGAWMLDAGCLTPNADGRERRHG